MPRLKRGSKALEKARLRIAGLRSISYTLDFGHGLNLVEYENRIRELEDKLSAYNTLLSTVDEMKSRLELMEQELSSFSERMLLGVAAKYGRNSSEYLQAGGTLRKGRKIETRSNSLMPFSPYSEHAETNGTNAASN